jgi:hypothetical protein
LFSDHHEIKSAINNKIRNQKTNLPFRNICKLGVVAHAYNHSYFGGRDWEGHSSRAAQAKS